MAASPAYLAALRAATQGSVINPDPADPVDYAGITVAPGPEAPIQPLGPARPDLPDNDPISRLEATDQRLVADPISGRIGAVGGPVQTPAEARVNAPSAPISVGLGVPTPTRPTVKKTISDEWGTRDVDVDAETGAPVGPLSGLFKSPTSGAPVTLNATTGNAVDPNTGADISVRQPTKFARGDDAGDIAYKPKAGAQGSAGGGGFAIGKLGGSAGGGAAKPFQPPSGVARAMDESEGALRDITSAQQHANDAETVGFAQSRKLAEDQAQEIRARAKMADDEALARQDAIDAESKRLASVKIDPDRVWHNDDGHRTAAFLIAAALGGWVAGYRGGPNQGLEAAQRMIDRDIDAQKSDIESGRVKLQDMRGSLAEFYKRTGNLDQSIALAQAKGYDQLAAQTKEYMAGANSELIQANGAKALADYHLGKEQWLEQAAVAQQKANAAAAGAGNARQKKFEELTDKYVSDGKSLHDAQRLAAGVLGLGDWGDQAGVKKGEAGKMEERQTANDEANSMFSSVKKSPVLDKLGIVSSIGSKLPGSIAPESNITAAQVKGLNLELLGAASKVLKDNEGRIPPATLERLHELEIPIGTTDKRVALAQVQAYQDFVNSLARQGGASAPQPTNGESPRIPGFKPVE